ncbi:hypothetical protein VTO73DRAFT_5724 [Trametes versicolor]
MTTAIACNLSAGTVVEGSLRVSIAGAGCVPGLDARVSSEREPQLASALEGGRALVVDASALVMGLRKTAVSCRRPVQRP